MRKVIILSCLIFALLLSAVSVVMAADAENVQFFKETELSFAAYTEGAANAFDGNADTGYSGSITGQFAKKSVIMGVTVKASSPIVNLSVKGSENGVDWVELYTQKKIGSVAIFGSNGSGSISDLTCDNMFTYAFKYLRFEMEYGTISEIIVRGYEMDTVGQIAELDTTFGKGGYQTSGSYYSDYNRMPYVINHCIHSTEKGEAIIAPAGETFAYATLKVKGDAPITEIALCHKNDKNTNRWNDVLIEVSTDGQTWTKVTQLASNINELHNFRERTVFLVKVDNPNNLAYTYARVSSNDGSAISIAVFDLYTATTPATVPATILSGWEGDPYIAEKAPAESTSEKEEENTPTSTQPVEETEATTTTVDEPKSGCGSMIGSEIAILMSMIALMSLALKRKKVF